jgi:hypothetical protein
MKKLLLGVLLLVSIDAISQVDTIRRQTLLPDVTYTMGAQIKIISDNDAVSLLLRQKFATVIIRRDTSVWSKTHQMYKRNYIYIPLNMEDSLRHIFNR